MSLPRHRILRKRSHFLAVRAHGETKPGRFMLVNTRKDAHGDGPGAPSMFGFLTPRYVGKAHERNLVRRRLRAIVREDEAGIKTGCHIVLVSRRGIAKASYQQLQAEWRRLAKGLGIFTAPRPGPTMVPDSENRKAPDQA